jgi:hypothetical protein
MIHDPLPGLGTVEAQEVFRTDVCWAALWNFFVLTVDIFSFLF